MQINDNKQMHRFQVQLTQIRVPARRQLLLFKKQSLNLLAQQIITESFEPICLEPKGYGFFMLGLRSAVCEISENTIFYGG